MYLHPMCIAYLLFASPFDFTYRAIAYLQYGWLGSLRKLGASPTVARVYTRVGIG